MSLQTQPSPVTGPHSEYEFEQSPLVHVDRTEAVRRVVELGERYLYEYRRLTANLKLDVAAGQADLAILEANRLEIIEATQ